MSYNHAEAFCVMTYRTEDDAEQEILWNSRDGVTPFCIQLKSGRLANHVEWGRDFADPEYWKKLKPGDRMFVDLTMKRAIDHRRSYVGKYWDHMMAQHYRTQSNAIRQLAKADLETGGGGAPDVIEVTQEMIDVWFDGDFQWPLEGY